MNGEFDFTTDPLSTSVQSLQLGNDRHDEVPPAQTVGSSGPPAVTGGVLDYTGDKTERRVEAPREGKYYDPREKEDAARRRIAYSLIAILAITIVLMFALVIYSIIKVDQIKEFSVILGPLVTLVSAATGFYYGTRTNK